MAVILVSAGALGGQQLPIAGQDEPRIVPRGVTGYDPRISLPEQVIGHVLGARHSEPYQIAAYFEAVARQSDRVVLQEHGRTYENRPLIHAVVTSPANHARLEEIRLANARLSDAPGQVGDEQLGAMPAVLFMMYSIHGNESSGVEAAMATLYHLAAGQGPGVEEALDQLVIVIDPMMNPDGLQRFATWVNQNRGAVAVTDPQNREHREPWPGGRGNHYLFDPNRDWLLLQHPEGQARQRLLNSWRPQALGDWHEMNHNASYFYKPGVPKRMHPLIPKPYRELIERMSHYHARALDEVGQLSYTEETFDDFYIGKGSTYPAFNGGIGILYEQASSRALMRDTERGPLTYAIAVRNHAATSLSMIEAVKDMRLDLLRYQRDFYAQASGFAAEQEETAFVFAMDEDRTRAQLLAQLLTEHRIELYELAARYETEDRTFEPGEAFIVPVDQPQARLLMAMLEARTTFEDDQFYDVSSWTLPLAYGIPYAAIREDTRAYLGERYETHELDGGELIGERSEVAYVLLWDRYYAPRALHRLQEAGARTFVNRRPMQVRVEGQRIEVPRGSITIPVSNLQDGITPENLHELVATCVRRDHVRMVAVSGSLTEEGPDLGTQRHGAPLAQPVVALVTGPTSASTFAGEVWHLLSERFEMPVTLLHADYVRGADMTRYNRLILAGGGLGSLNTEAVDAWVKNGGTLIATGTAVSWVVKEKLVELEEREFDIDEQLVELPYDELDAARGRHRVGGSILSVELDETHPIAFGYGSRVAMFRQHAAAYGSMNKPGTMVGRYADPVLLSGYLSEQRERQLAGSAAIVAVRHGQGRIVLFLDNPNTRAFWFGTNGLFLNAVFFGDVF